MSRSSRLHGGGQSLDVVPIQETTDTIVMYRKEREASLSEGSAAEILQEEATSQMPAELDTLSTRDHVFAFWHGKRSRAHWVEHVNYPAVQVST